MVLDAVLLGLARGRLMTVEVEVESSGEDEILLALPVHCVFVSGLELQGQTWLCVVSCVNMECQDFW